MIHKFCQATLVKRIKREKQPLKVLEISQSFSSNNNICCPWGKLLTHIVFECFNDGYDSSRDKSKVAT